MDTLRSLVERREVGVSFAPSGLLPRGETISGSICCRLRYTVRSVPTCGYRFTGFFGIGNLILGSGSRVVNRSDTSFLITGELDLLALVRKFLCEYFRLAAYSNCN